MEWLRAHKVPAAVFVLAAAFGSFELLSTSKGRNDAEDPSWFLARDANIVDVSHDLYPERATSLYYRAYQAALCEAASPEARTACLERGEVEPGEIRDLIERSLATGNRSLETTLYNHALILLHEGAPDEEVDAAIRRWRISHPGSRRPDPRAAFAARDRLALDGDR